MPQFPMTDSRRKVLERVPDYAVKITPAGNSITVSYNGNTIAKTDAALLIEETRHDGVFYLPRESVNMELLESTDLSTYCQFKGHASYWSFKGVPDLENFVWSYQEPYPEVAGLKDYMSFYTNKVDVVVD
jgi:uncharacterized protein (DUF427 family)